MASNRRIKNGCGRKTFIMDILKASSNADANDLLEERNKLQTILESRTIDFKKQIMDLKKLNEKLEADLRETRSFVTRLNSACDLKGQQLGARNKSIEELHGKLTMAIDWHQRDKELISEMTKNINDMDHKLKMIKGIVTDDVTKDNHVEGATFLSHCHTAGPDLSDCIPCDGVLSPFSIRS